jgi:hypothetical protein
VFHHYQAGTIGLAARLSYLVFILILVFVDPSPATSTTHPAEGMAILQIEGHGDHYVERVSGVEVG